MQKLQTNCTAIQCWEIVGKNHYNEINAVFKREPFTAPVPGRIPFQSWHNTSELFLRITELIHAAFDKNSVAYAVLLDISSAYDSVWRDGLRHKMRKKFHLTGRLYWWLDSFLKDRVGQVVLNGISTIVQKFETGMPQGSSLSPLLFLLYINDITKVVQYPIQCGMFADDVALWKFICNYNYIYYNSF